MDATPIELQLPRVGEIVHQGLPLLAIADANGASVTIASPITGMIVDVNSALNENPDLLWNHPCGLGWVAKIAPTRLESEEARLQKREVLAVTVNQDFRRFYRDKLSGIGCAARDVDPADAEALVAAARTSGVALFDAASAGVDGPNVVGRLLQEVPEAKVVVVAPAGLPQQELYRAHRLFYYAVPPLEDDEILAIIDSCYGLPTASKSSSPAPSSQNLPVSALHVDTDQGTRVTLLASGDLLQREAGLGLALRTRLLERLLPLETGLGDVKLTRYPRPSRDHEKRSCLRVDHIRHGQDSRLPRALPTGKPGAFHRYRRRELDGAGRSTQPG